MHRGYVKTWRRLFESDLWLAEPFTRGQAWIDLVGNANHKDGFIRKRGIKVEVKRGQLGWSEIRLADRWKWSRGKVRRFLKELEKDEKITQQKTQITTLINIINYEIYQGNGTTDETTDGQQTDNKRYTNKNEKNGKKEGKKKSKNSPPTIDEVIAYFTEKGYTVESAKKAYEYYDAADWHDSRGNPVKSWKQKMLSVWFKPENETPKETIKERVPF